MKIRYCEKWDTASRELAAEFCRLFFISRFKGAYTLYLLKEGFTVNLDVRPWCNEDDLEYENVVTFFLRKDGSLDCSTYTKYYGDHIEETGKPENANEMLEYIRNSGILSIMKS